MLDHDTLLIIFKSNTDMFAPGANGCLTALRHYSQTCKDWRYLILETPSLWAQTMDFGDPSMSAGYWREQVLARSGHSRIWIQYRPWYGVCTVQMLHVVESLRLVVDKEWHRIQRLSIILPRIKLPKKFIRRWSSIFYRGAPELISFDLCADTLGSTFVGTASSARTFPSQDFSTEALGSPLNGMPLLTTLFAGSAPSLTDLHLYQSITAPQASSWFPNLHTLHSDHTTNIGELFKVINHCSRLNDLRVRLSDEIRPEEDNTLPHVSLDFLHHLYITVKHIRDLTTMISDLSIPQSCSLHFFNMGEAHINPSTNSVLGPIIRLIKGFMSHYQPASLSVTILRDEGSIPMLVYASGTQPDYFFAISTENRVLFSFRFLHYSQNGFQDADQILSCIFEGYRSQLLIDNNNSDMNNISACVKHVTLAMKTINSDALLLFVKPLLQSFTWLSTLRMTYNDIPRRNLPTPVTVPSLGTFLEQLPRSLRVVNLKLVMACYIFGSRENVELMGLHGADIEYTSLRTQLGWHHFLEADEGGLV